MRIKPLENHTAQTHQTVTGIVNVAFGSKTIQIRPTNQRLSGHAGQSTFWAFLHRGQFRQVLTAALPQRPTSPNALPPCTIALSFIAGILAGADKLARMAWLRADPVLPELLQVRRLVSQSTLSRFLQGFNGAAVNVRCFEPLWQWCLEQLPSRRAGYTLDVDSTALVHEDGHQQGVRVGYTRLGLKPCQHPLLAVLAEVKLAAGFWLRQGNASSASNVVSFTCQLLARLPRQVRVGLVRADSGFCQEAWLALLEQRRLPYIVAAQLSVKLQSLIKRDMVWQPTAVPGLEVGEVRHHGLNWSRPRRIILLRRQRADGRRSAGKTLLAVPGYQFQALVTSLEWPAVQVWRRYHGRAELENVIKELDADFGLPGLCCHSFWATEAALSLAVLTYNLVQRFLRHLGWLHQATAGTLRHRLWNCAGIISRAQGRCTLRLGISPPQRKWWHTLWEKITAPFPNCNAVDQNPPNTPVFRMATA
jgi:hypothetical protein